MKNGTKIAELARIADLNGVHDAGYESLKVERSREIYGVLYKRLQDIQHLEETGYDISITLHGVSRTITLTAAEAEAAFDFDNLIDKVVKRLDAKYSEIIGNLLDIEKGEPLDRSFVGTDTPEFKQALALCLPHPLPQEAQHSAS